MPVRSNLQRILDERDMDKALSNYDGTTTQQNLIGGEF